MERLPMDEISVIVPVRNDLEALRDTISALRCELGNEAEIVVVDGQSTDDTWTWASGLARRVPGIKAVRATGRRYVEWLGAGYARASFPSVVVVDASADWSGPSLRFRITRAVQKSAYLRSRRPRSDQPFLTTNAA